MFKSIEWVEQDRQLRLLDQSVLPAKTVYLNCNSVQEVATAIKDMVVRGAPVIGVAAAYGLVLAANSSEAGSISELEQVVDKADKLLRESRPTAVNLFWALDQIALRISKLPIKSADDYRQCLLSCAHELAKEDVGINKAIAENGLTLMPNSSVKIIHHCNTGSLATVDYGTALGVIRMAHEQGLDVEVFVDETRPRLQGARLTSWELAQQGIPHRLIVDGASAHVMDNFNIDMCVVGCDRVAANGDFANKVGTRNLATIAKAAGVPFYVAAPLSTIDMETSKGSDIEIEERDGEEVTVIDGQRVAPENVRVYNPAFDVTPADLVTAFITEKGIVYPPFSTNLAQIKKET